MADRYLVASGSWSDSSIWSATSGGAGGAGVPTASDYVYLDKNYTLTLDVDASCGGLTHTNGTLSLSSYSLSIAEDTSGYGGGLVSSGTAVRTLNLNSGTLSVGTTGIPGTDYTNVWVNLSGTNLTVNAGTSLVILNVVGTDLLGSFQTLSKSFNDVRINMGDSVNGGQTLNITGSPTFRLLDIRSANSAAHTVRLSNDTITAEKLVMLGASTANRLYVLTASAPGQAIFSPASSSSTMYGQFVSVDSLVLATGWDKPYIGSNSVVTNNSGGTALWLTQDPPKISTLVDPLTTAPGSNTNWIASGTVTQVTSGKDGGGYKLASGASLVSTGTYDLTESEIVIERPVESTANGNFGVDSLGGLNNNPGSNSVWSNVFDFSGTKIDVGYKTKYSQSGGGSISYEYPIISSKYWKFGVSGSTLSLRLSNDGIAWSAPDTLSLNEQEISLFKSVRIRGDGGIQSIGSINPVLTSAPVLTTASATSITNTTATTGGNVTSDGGATVTERGVVYSTSANPTTASSKKIVTGTTGAFTASLTGLTTKTKYYVRAYAINSVGTAYGSEVNFTTAGAPVANFTASSTNVKVGTSVSFTDTSTYAPTSWLWNFGDSTTSTSKNPTKSYSTNGVYTVTLTVTNAYGSNTKTSTNLITAYDTPTLTSSASDTITWKAATVYGNVTADRNSTVTERGFVYSTSPNPTTANTKQTIAGTTGSYNAILTGLSGNTTYYVRAYAINAAGTSYATQQSFTTQTIPSATTGTAGSLTLSGATISSNVINNPDSLTLTEYGIVYGTSASPTTADSKKTSTSSIAGYNCALTGLAEATKYYVRAYVIFDGVTYYGSQIDFNTTGRPVLTLDSPTNNGSAVDTKPQLKFTGTDPDNDNITYQLQLNSTNSFTTPLLDKLSASDTGFSNLSTTKTDPFYNGNQIQYAISTDLSRGQSYYWRVRGQDVTGTNTWGNWSTTSKFTISAIAPDLTTNGVSNITFNTADVASTINSDGGATIIEKGVVYSTSTNPTITDSKVIVTGASPYVANLTGLVASTTYYARAYATNSVGTAYGNNISFQTSQTPAVPTVTTGSASSTTDITSRFNGNEVTKDGTFAVTERGIVFSDTSTTPTTADRKIVAPSAGLGIYDLKITGLDPETTYHVRAYAVNSFGTGYGSTVDFTTAAPYAPDEGDGYWSWAPGQSQATVGRTQATPANSSINLPLEDLGLIDGQIYTFYYGSVDFDNGAARVTIERYNDATKISNPITAGVPYTFTYDETLIHWNIRLFVTDTAEADTITAVFNDLYLAQESSFSGFVPFTRRGITELKLINNEIVDDRREDVISSIFDQVTGASWYPFNIDTEGLGYFEIGDRFTIRDNNGDEKSVAVWNTKLTIDGGISENLYTNKPDLTETDYSKAGNSRLRGNVRQTSLKVDKQQGTIDALVSDMYDLDGVVNTKFTELKQDNESIIATVQGAGGVNLLKNSVMYAFDDDGLPDSWSVTGALVIQASPESLAAGAVSGNQFTLNGTTATQTVTVRKDVDFIPEDEKTYYSISARVKKNTVGSASITLTNRNETLTIDLPDQTSYYWDIVSLEGILPKDDHYDISITSDSDLQVTDLILAPGQTRHEWTQANGEVMNSSVAITKDGVTIRSSTLQNNYTKIDALGFEVHKTDAGGERIFGFNDDETNVSKLKADKQIAMAPMRIVPVNFGGYVGWAFTRTKEDN